MLSQSHEFADCRIVWGSWEEGDEKMRRGRFSANGAMMAVSVQCFIALVVPASAEAASIFSNYEFHSFRRDVLPVLLMALAGIVVAWQLRKKIRQQSVSAPPYALRSPQEQRLHNLSLLSVIAPLFYAVLFEADLIAPFITILVAQSVGLAASRVLGLPFGWRLFSILPVSLLSVLAGASAMSWPTLTLWPTVDQAWVLTAAAICFALGNLLSYLSFPPAYRQRAW
jgi:hypothetical protein